MKIFFKGILSIFAKFFIILLFRFNVGRFLIDKIINVILSEKKKVSHNGVNLRFYTPNRINFYRIKTFSTKEPETLEWMDGFQKDKVFWDIGANIGLYSIYAALKHPNIEIVSFCKLEIFSIFSQSEEMIISSIFFDLLISFATYKNIGLPFIGKIFLFFNLLDFFFAGITTFFFFIS